MMCVPPGIWMCLLDITCWGIPWKSCMKRAGITRNQTDHSLRLTSTTQGLDMGIPKKLLIERTEHRSCRGFFASLSKTNRRTTGNGIVCPFKIWTSNGFVERNTKKWRKKESPWRVVLGTLLPFKAVPCININDFLRDYVYVVPRTINVNPDTYVRTQLHYTIVLHYCLFWCIRLTH